MATTLIDLQVTEVSLVDAGANKKAKVVLLKRDTTGKPAPHIREEDDIENTAELSPATARLEREANALVEKHEAKTFGEAIEIVGRRDQKLYEDYREEQLSR